MDKSAGASSFRLLGQVAALDGAGNPVNVGSPRRRAVLAALLVRAGSSVSVEQLVDQLWEAAPPPTAATMVHSAVATLRRVLEPDPGRPRLLVTAAGGYALRAGPVSIDAVRFESLLGEGRKLVAAGSATAFDVLSKALALWTGPAFAGLDLRFARDAAARLDELRVDCEELRAEAALALGWHRETVAELEALVARHPLRERLRAHLILALYRSGRQSDALAAYHDLRRILADELGLQPGAELQRLEVAILRQSPELDLRPPEFITAGRPALPEPISSFVGREQELAEVLSLIGAHRLVTLTGPGGTGKTRLAVEAARRLARHGPRGLEGAEAHLVDLAPLSTPELVASVLADALGVGAQPGQPLLVTVAAALGGRPVVVVLDNCEHLLEACAALAHDLLTAAPELRLLATSRAALALPGEQVYAVPPLALPADGAGWEATAACEAVRLFAARAAAARRGFAVTEENAGTVGEVCRGLDGLPLALELAAAKTGALPLRELAGRLYDRVLDARLPAARHRSLAATVAWSYDLLEPAEQALLTRAAVFPAGFTLTAAEAVTAGEGVPAGEVASLLGRLVSCSTVSLDDPAGGTPRYGMLETTRQFARERLGAVALAVLRERHARHYLDYAAEVERHLIGSESPPWLARLRAERANLRAALQWAFGPGGDPEVGAGIVRCLGFYWDLRGARGEGLHWVHLGLAAVGPHRPDERMALLSAGALMHVGLAEFGPTAALAGEQLVLAREAGAGRWEGDALAMFATIAWAHGRFDRAQQLYEDAVRASLAGGDLWRAALEEAQLARLHRDRDEPDAARAVALRSLAHAEEVGEDLARGLALDVLASLEHRWGAPREARRLAGAALERYRRVGYLEGEASALQLEGRIALAARDAVRARQAFDQALALYRRIGHRAGTVAALEGIAEFAAAGGDPAAAGEASAAAAALRAEIGLPARGPADRRQLARD